MWSSPIYNLLKLSSLESTQALETQLNSSTPAILSKLLFVPSNRIDSFPWKDLPQCLATANAPVLGGIIDGFHKPNTNARFILCQVNNRNVIPFSVPDGFLRQQFSKSVGRWPDRTRRESLVKQDSFLHMQGKNAGLHLDQVQEELEEQDFSKKFKSSVFPSLNFTPNLFLIFSDTEPHEFLQFLDIEYPKALKFGLITTQTPFLTGSPHFLWNHQKETQTGGLVGYALDVPDTMVSSIQNPGLRAIGKRFRISDYKGNVVLKLDGIDATSDVNTLMHEEVGNVSKDFSLFASVSQAKSKPFGVFKVIGGDPSRGSLAFETEVELEEGMEIQFMIPDEPTRILSSSQLHFSVRPPGRNEVWTELGSKTLGMYSSSGLIYGKPGEKTCLLKAPFSSISLDF